MPFLHLCACCSQTSAIVLVRVCLSYGHLAIVLVRVCLSYEHLALVLIRVCLSYEHLAIVLVRVCLSYEHLAIVLVRVCLSYGHLAIVLVRVCLSYRNLAENVAVCSSGACSIYFQCCFLFLRVLVPFLFNFNVTISILGAKSLS